MTDETPASEKKQKKQKNAAPATVKLYSVGRVPTAEDKLSPQAKAIYDVVAAAEGDFTRKELIKELEGKLTTRQDVGNVLNFYMKRLTDGGFLKVVESPKAA